MRETDNQLPQWGTDDASTISILYLDDEPWFVARDACRCLGIRVGEGGTNQSLRHLAADEKRNTRVQTPGIRGNPNKTVISESGLYKLVMRSDKPDACAFQDWLAREVLPAIRNDGAYILGEEKVRTGEMSEAELAMQAVAALNAKLARLTAERDQLAVEKAAAEARAVAAETKAAALDHLAGAEGLLTITEAANLLGMRSAIALNRTLENAKVLRRVRGIVVPTAAYARKGYFRVVSREVNGHVREQTMWTAQGIAWAAQRLSKAWAAAG